MAADPSILAWRTPWTEKAGELQSMELQKSRTRLSDKARPLTSKIYKKFDFCVTCSQTQDLLYIIFRKAIQRNQPSVELHKGAFYEGNDRSLCHTVIQGTLYSPPHQVSMSLGTTDSKTKNTIKTKHVHPANIHSRQVP